VPHEGRIEGSLLVDCKWVPLVGVVVHLGRTLGASAMVGVGDLTWAK
jgi:hypothetical protein